MQDGILSNVTLICLAPIFFLALWGTGVFGGGDGLPTEERALCFGGVAVLGFVAVLEYDNGAPWHILKGVAVGDLLLQYTARLVVFCTIRALPTWKRLPVLLSLLAPLFYPTVVQAVHRLQVSKLECRCMHRTHLGRRQESSAIDFRCTRFCSARFVQPN